MIRISKFVVGIRPSQKMFRVSSLYGSLVDTILSLRGTKLFEDEYYTEVSRNVEQGTVQLRNEELGNILRIDQDNVVFTKDYYLNEKKHDINDALQEFRTIWKHLNDELHARNIRRIGIVAEHQIVAKDTKASETLLKALTTITTAGHPAKFILKIEDRRLPTKGGIPDIKKDDFINVIREFYDSDLDVDHAKTGSINVNIDVQRYYSPLFNGNVFDEVTVLQKLFMEEKARLEDDLKKRGLV